MLYWQVLKLFKLLHRTRQEVFKNDAKALEGEILVLCCVCLPVFLWNFPLRIQRKRILNIIFLYILFRIFQVIIRKTWVSITRHPLFLKQKKMVLRFKHPVHILEGTHLFFESSWEEIFFFCFLTYTLQSSQSMFNCTKH